MVNKMEKEIKNAIIEGTQLGSSGDRGIFSSWLTLNYGGSGQGFGGFALDSYSKEKGKRIPHMALAIWVSRILEVTKIADWEKLKGTPIRVITENDKIIGIGNFIEDKWFYPVDEFNELKTN